MILWSLLALQICKISFKRWFKFCFKYLHVITMRSDLPFNSFLKKTNIFSFNSLEKVFLNLSSSGKSSNHLFTQQLSTVDTQKLLQYILSHSLTLREREKKSRGTSCLANGEWTSKTPFKLLSFQDWRKRQN